MRRRSSPEFGLRKAMIVTGLLASAALAGCGKDTGPIRAHLNFDGTNDDPELCQPTPDGSAPGFRPCFLPLRALVGGTSDTNPVLNKVDLVLPDGTKTASWPYEQYDGPDDSQSGDTITVVCTETVKATEPGKDDEQFGGVSVSESQLNLSAAPNVRITLHEGEPVVYGRLKWMFPEDGRSFSELPTCDTYLGSSN